MLPSQGSGDQMEETHGTRPRRSQCQEMLSEVRERRSANSTVGRSFCCVLSHASVFFYLVKENQTLESIF